MAEKINGYEILRNQWDISGECAEWNVGRKDGNDFFIKRIRDITYPVDELRKDPQAYNDMKNEAESWFDYRCRIKDTLSELGSGRGNIVRPVDYFLDDCSYYEVAHLIDVTSLNVFEQSTEDKAFIMMTAALALSDISERGIVHADLDPSNLIISTSDVGKFVVKVIDFTGAFFEDEVPDKISYKPAYASPEIGIYCERLSPEEKRNPDYKKEITCKADVFSLGIVFHMYCQSEGRRPVCEGGDIWEAVCDGRAPQIDESVDPAFRDIIQRMLSYDAKDRPAMSEIHKEMQEIWNRCQSGEEKSDRDASAGNDDIKHGLKDERREEGKPREHEQEHQGEKKPGIHASVYERKKWKHYMSWRGALSERMAPQWIGWS